MSNQNNWGGAGVEITDDGPKWRAITVLIFGVVFGLVLLALGVIVINQLGLADRATIAAQEQAVISAAVRPDKIAVWRLALASLAVSVVAIPVMAWAFALAYSVRVIRQLRSPNITILPALPASRSITKGDTHARYPNRQ